MSPKEKFALYLTTEMKMRLERRYTEDGSRSLTGFIENAINFYLDYLSANNAGMFLPASVQSYLDGRMNQFEDRMASLLYKQSVELDTPATSGRTSSPCIEKTRSVSVTTTHRHGGPCSVLAATTSPQPCTSRPRTSGGTQRSTMKVIILTST